MNDYNNQQKWCPSCLSYVRYLYSVQGSYCTVCDSRVRLFPEPVIPDYVYFPKEAEVRDVPHYTDDR